MNEQCEAVPGGMIRCREMATGYFRAKDAGGRLRDFPLCSQHLTAWRQADQQDEERKSRKRAQAAFVKQWREEHAKQTWGATWPCPLCCRVIQVGLGIPDSDIHMFATQHQIDHGADWTAYTALATADPRPAPTTTGRE